MENQLLHILGLRQHQQAQSSNLQFIAISEEENGNKNNDFACREVKLWSWHWYFVHEFSLVNVKYEFIHWMQFIRWGPHQRGIDTWNCIILNLKPHSLYVIKCDLEIFTNYSFHVHFPWRKYFSFWGHFQNNSDGWLSVSAAGASTNSQQTEIGPGPLMIILLA